MDEICPACTTVHLGFDPRPEQRQSFWQCRRCNVKLFTVKIGNTWEVHGEAQAESLGHHLPTMRQYNETLYRLQSFVYHPIFSDIIRATEEAVDASDFYSRLTAIHEKHKVKS